jgi:U-box domain
MANYLDGFDESFICPITFSVMVDPVILTSGVSYERAQITAWLREHHTCPMTNQEITSDPIPNINLRQAIQLYNERVERMPQSNPISQHETLLLSEVVIARCHGRDTRVVQLEAGKRYFIDFRYANIVPFSFSVVNWELSNETTGRIMTGTHELRYPTGSRAIVVLRPVNVCTLHMHFVCATWVSDFIKIGISRVSYTVTEYN